MVRYSTGRKFKFSDLSRLHVRDLFAGTPAAPKRLPPEPEKKRRVFVPPPREIKPPEHFTAIGCPCCKRAMNVPDLEVIIDYYDIPPMEEAILRSVWRGKGSPVPNQRIIDAMYSDDPDGGPDPSRAYLALKVSMCHLRKRLTGSGVFIENAGYRLGYRLNLKNVGEL